MTLREFGRLGDGRHTLRRGLDALGRLPRLSAGVHAVSVAGSTENAEIARLRGRPATGIGSRNGISSAGRRSGSVLRRAATRADLTAPGMARPAVARGFCDFDVEAVPRSRWAHVAAGALPVSAGRTDRLAVEATRRFRPGFAGSLRVSARPAVDLPAGEAAPAEFASGFGVEAGSAFAASPPARRRPDKMARAGRRP